MRKISQRLNVQSQKKRPADDTLDSAEVHYHQSWQQGMSRPMVSYQTTMSTVNTTPSFDLDMAGSSNDIFLPLSVLPHSHMAAHSEEHDDDNLYMDPELQQAAEEIHHVPSVCCQSYTISVYALTFSISG